MASGNKSGGGVWAWPLEIIVWWGEGGCGHC